MPSPRLLAAALLAMTWFMAALHVELEGNGLLPEHSHHGGAGHSHDHGHAHEEPGGADDAHGLSDHGPVVARGTPGLSPLILLLGQLASAGASVWALAWLTNLVSRPRLDRPKPWLKIPPWAYGLATWRFLRRCVADSLAPPALA